MASAIDRTVGDIGAFSKGKFVQPALSFPADALAPFYERKQLMAHYRCHGKFVRLMNLMLDHVEAGVWPASARTAHAMNRMLTFYGGVHALDCLFWELIRPGGRAVPEALSAAMRSQYGSVQAAQFYFSSMCKVARQRGWGVMGYASEGEKLVIFHTGEFINLRAWPVVPLLICDMWESAYQLQYGDDRDKWVDSFMQMVNWERVAERYAAVRKKLSA